MPARADCQKLAASKFDQEEESAAGLHVLADLAEQVGLAGSGRAADHHAQRAGVGFPFGIAEGGHHVGHRPVVQPAHVQRALRVPQVVGGRRPGEAERAERFAVLKFHQDSIAIRCLSWLPISTAASRSAG